MEQNTEPGNRKAHRGRNKAGNEKPDKMNTEERKAGKRAAGPPESGSARPGFFLLLENIFNGLARNFVYQNQKIREAGLIKNTSICWSCCRSAANVSETKPKRNNTKTQKGKLRPRK